MLSSPRAPSSRGCSQNLSQRFVGSGGGGADSQREGGPTAPQLVSRNGGLDIGCQERLGGSGSGGWGPLEWVELAICG